MTAHKKHTCSLPLIGVNTFLSKEHAGETVMTIELSRSTEDEKNQQIANVEAYRANRNEIHDKRGQVHLLLTQGDFWSAASADMRDAIGLVCFAAARQVSGFYAVGRL